MNFRSLKSFLLFVVVSFCSGCKLAVISIPFGEITSSNASYNCAAGSVCETKLSPGFSESFTATAKPGYQFVKWQKGDGFLCGDSTNATCTVTIPNGDPGTAIAALQHIGFLMPVYVSNN